MINSFCCPRCRGSLTARETAYTCPVCGSVATLLTPRILNFLDGDEGTARSILEWSDDFLSNTVRCFQSDREGKAIPDRFLSRASRPEG